MFVLEKLDFLIEYLLKENQEIIVNKVPTNIDDKKNLYRSLCNIREPRPISKKYLQVEDKYLQEELKTKGIEENIENSKIIDTIYLWKGDITTLKVEAVVNAANSQGIGCFIPCHKCIDNCIHSASRN